MLDFILDFLFPKKCVGCNEEGSYFCEKCCNEIDFCQPVLVRMKAGPLEGVVAAGKYQGTLKEAIHIFKYEKVKDLADSLSEILAKVLRNKNIDFLQEYSFIPVPLFSKKEKERGFNQSELHLDALKEKINIKCVPQALEKIKDTLPQMSLKRKERGKNLFGAFAVKDRREVRGKNIVLLDDVMTTGATLHECAKVLRRAGAKKVFGLILAR